VTAYVGDRRHVMDDIAEGGSLDKQNVGHVGGRWRVPPENYFRWLIYAAPGFVTRSGADPAPQNCRATLIHGQAPASPI
jgi:hypothetical protein